VRAFRTAVVALTLIVSLHAALDAQQNLAFSLFERSLEQLRLESGIPGLSAVILQERQVVRAFGLGMADVERSIAALPDTPYLVGDLTQTLAATLLLQRIDRGDFELNDRMQRWTALIPETPATVGQVLRHTTTGTYRYDPVRFGAIEPVIEYYARQPLQKVLAAEILDFVAMRRSVPGADVAQGSAPEARLFDADDLARYRAVMQDLAVPYRVDLQRRASRSEIPIRRLTAEGGLVSSALDLARFDAALDADNLLLSTAARDAMRQRGGASVPTGLGGFVQPYNNEILVWHFGNIPNAYSSLIIKVPQRELTFILLANSDGLSAPFSLEEGDVTRSLFARLFLRTFLP
jgi:CubicO group peptidase (beta-lactamase class C family)